MSKETVKRKEGIKGEVLRAELDQLRMMRRRAGDDPLRASVIAERELEIEGEIQKLEVSV